VKKWENLINKIDIGENIFEHKPRIMIFIEPFEKKYKGKIADDLLTNAACIAVATYLFGPLEEEELNVYALAIKKRVQDYRNSLH
jgi:hypothetical protein